MNPRLSIQQTIFACCTFVIPLSQPNAQIAKIDSFINQQMMHQKIIGLSVGVVKNGKILMAKGYGHSNLEHNIPTSENTVYKLASLSKQMVAAGIMLLVQEGKLKLTDSITKFFKDAPPSWNQVNVRHLLTHTAGFPRQITALRPMEVQADSSLIHAEYRTKFLFPPGTSFQYSNVGYLMLGEIIRQTSGQSFSDFMREKVFKKNELMNTQTTSLRALVQNRAGGYVRSGDSIFNAQNNLALVAGAAFLSSISDMLKWEMLMQNNLFLTDKAWRQMWSDTEKSPDLSGDGAPDEYGYGWGIAKFGTRTVVAHAGAMPGFRSVYYRFPSEKTAVIILINSEPVNVALIADGVTEIVLGY